jgi:hypothetical protein
VSLLKQPRRIGERRNSSALPQGRAGTSSRRPLRGLRGAPVNEQAPLFLSLRKQPRRIGERLEFQRIAAGIEQEHRRAGRCAARAERLINEQAPLFLSLRKQPRRIGERLEFQRIAAGIEQEHRRLFTHLSLKRMCGSMMKRTAAARSLAARASHSGIGSTTPKWRTGTASPSTSEVTRCPASSGARWATI